MLDPRIRIRFMWASVYLSAADLHYNNDPVGFAVITREFGRDVEYTKHPTTLQQGKRSKE